MVILMLWIQIKKTIQNNCETSTYCNILTYHYNIRMIDKIARAYRSFRCMLNVDKSSQCIMTQVVNAGCLLFRTHKFYFVDVLMLLLPLCVSDVALYNTHTHTYNIYIYILYLYTSTESTLKMIREKLENNMYVKFSRLFTSDNFFQFKFLSDK